MKRLFLKSFLFVLMANIFVLSQTRVTILHVNDVYQFTPIDGGTRGGLARLLTLKKEALAQNPNTIFTLGGDTISPSVESRTFKGAQMIDAWNALGIDFAVFGNHEFDVKTDVLLQRMKESKFVWLGANVIDTKTHKIFADTPPFAIKEFNGVKIGFIGLLLPETKTTSSMESFLAVSDYCQTAKKIVKEMRKRAKVNAVIGLTHLSMTEDKNLTRCADFDLILGGHEHSLLQSSANGTPIFKMTANASELGKFSLNFDSNKHLQSIDWQIIPVTDKIPDAPEFAAVTEKYKDIIGKLAEQIGQTSVVLDASTMASRTQETALGDFIADAYRNATNADIGFVNGGSIRADLQYNPGVLTKRDVLSILPFNNSILKIELNGKLLKDVLEHGVARSGIGEDAQPGRFPQVSGLSFKFDGTKPVGARIVEISIGNQPLNEKKTYTLATSEFLVLKGGDGYTMLKNAKILNDPATAPKDSDYFENAIRDAPGGVISPKIEGRIIKLN